MRSLLLVFVFGLWAGAGEPQVALKKELPDINLLPEFLPDKVEPKPVDPKVKTPLTLSERYHYIFDSKVPLIIKSAPDGLVTISKEAGPIRIKEFWSDTPLAKAKTTRTFKGDFVYELLPVKSGTLTLFVFKPGIKDEKEVFTRVIKVDTGVDPDPIIPPGPGPGPTPDVNNPLAGAGTRVLIVFETGTTYPAPLSSVFYGSKVRSWLDTNCLPTEGVDGRHEYNIWDKDTAVNLAPKMWQDAMAMAKGKELPYVIVTNGTKFYAGSFNEAKINSPESMIALLDKYKK